MKNRNSRSDLILCSLIQPGEQAEINSILLAESIRSFGGSLANCPVWFMFPEINKNLTSRSQDRLEELNIRMIPFPVDTDQRDFFFQVELSALGIAETLAEGQTDLLAWMASNTLVLNEPKQLLLPVKYDLAYKPVHHLLLGSKYDQPIDPFWQQIYQQCQVLQDRIFPMRPMVEDVAMRPYFNAGLLVIRPQQGLLRYWLTKFKEIHQLPVFRSFYLKDDRYEIFMHQAVLAGVILSKYHQTELLELSGDYNYPAHLWDKDTTALRPSSFDKIVTLRHEWFYREADWNRKMPIGRDKLNWLRKHLKVSGLASIDQDKLF